MSEKLSLLNDSSDSEVELKINKSYATSYDVWRNKEELQKYKDLRKEEDDSESSSESEDEVPEFDEEFFRALSLVKGKDPRIYDKNFELFKNKEIIKKPKTKKQSKMFMKDYERNLVLERGGKFSDEDDDENHIAASTSTYPNEQMENLKKLKEALGDSDAEEDDELLRSRIKTEAEEEAEEADYVKWLKGEEKEISDDVKKDMSYLRNYWNDPKLDEGEKFLRDYILNKRYSEKDDSEIPSYEELTSGMLSDDEKMLDEQEQFEHKYNFRFEEPDEEFIKRYPRTIGDSLRKSDNRRKQKREEKAERKRRDKEQRQEELKRLKALKRKEIEEKFMKLKEISGQDEINLDESDIESDFDPDKHDQKMREMFNDEYYQIEEDKKPEFPYDEELDSENWNTWSREKSKGDGGDDDENEDDDGEIMVKQEDEENDLDELQSNARDQFADEMISASTRKKKGKKKSLFAKVISQKKTIYDPDGKSFEEYLDEYYKLDYEDVIGDLPVRYKYRKVIPNDFGLTVDEILAADDRELNRWCSVKKTCQYRNDEEEFYDVQAFQKKAQNPLSKKKALPSVYAPKEDDNAFDDSENTDAKVKYENTETSLNRMTDEKDSLICGKNDNVEQIQDDDRECVETSRHNKKSKTKRRKQNSSSTAENEPEHTSGIIFETNGSSLESEVGMQCQEDDVKKFGTNADISLQSCEPKKKSKKKKHKGKQIISSLEVESEDCNVTNTYINLSKNIDESSEITISRKSSKRKRENDVSLSFEDSGAKTDENGSDVLSNKLLPIPKRSHVTVDNDADNEILISKNTNDVSAKKKKKKRKKNNTKDVNAHSSKSHPFHNKFSDKKSKQFVSQDKRLGLSDERLAAYGINPKKFKNKIIYSEK